MNAPIENTILENPTLLSAVQLAKTPRIARRVFRLLLIGLVLLPIVVIWVPWTQTVHGTGRAIAFNPVHRPQFVVSPIEGRIKKWHVVEGEHITAGQRIVEMVDNDPNLELRLLDEERAVLDRMRAAEGRVSDIEARLRNLEDSRRLAMDVQSSVLRQEQARVQAVQQELLEAKAALDAAEPNYKRQQELFHNRLGGLTSQRDLELAKQALETAQAKLNQAEARVKLAQAGELAARDNLDKVDSDTKAMINLETASRRSAESDVASIRRDKAQIEVRIARQRAQYVDAPVDGIVFRLLANAEAGGMLVRPGERLAVLVPDLKQGVDNIAKSAAPNASSSLAAAVKSPASLSPKTMNAEADLTAKNYPGIVVELEIDGNDLPLIQQGDRVRLQFEGWPAAQFTGWPAVAVGTFGGRVYLVDPTANEKGHFRILVEPDPADLAWPDKRYLRQGVRGQGWVLLDTVSVGWELWRRLNGFPPLRAAEEDKGGLPGGPVAPSKRK